MFQNNECFTSKNHSAYINYYAYLYVYVYIYIVTHPVNEVFIQMIFFIKNFGIKRFIIQHQ